MALVQAPGLAVADVLVQLQGLILGQDTHGIDPGVYAVTQGKVNDPVFAAEGDGGLGGLLRQNLQTAALAAGQKHGDYAFFLKIHGHSSLLKRMGYYALLKGKRQKGKFPLTITYHIFVNYERDKMPKISDSFWAS